MHKNIFRSTSSLVLVLAFVFALAAPQLQAQYDNGSIVGTIKDATGAPIAGAQVKVTNNATGIVATTKTGGSGDYELPNVKVGIYTISASAPNFSDAVAQNITVSVGNRQHIDLALKVGGTSATVEVSDVALQVETETSERGQTITNYQAEALPLVTRNYSDFLALVPGSRQAPTSANQTGATSLLRAGSYNVNGQRSMFNNFLLDGMDNNAYGESNQGFDNQIVAIPPDSVAQFQVVTNNESAEYGRSSGATINVASLSGTNKFHAVGYEFLRNTGLNAAGYFKPTLVGTSGVSVPFIKPTLNRNQYGFNFGGPIVKDKFFFFLDYEGFRQTLSPLTVLTLPTQNELNGILTVDVKNPFTSQLYTAGTSIFAQGYTPVAQVQQVLNAFNSVKSALPVSGPLLVGSTYTGGAVANDYSIQAPFTDHSDKGDLRLDWQIDPASSAFLRISDRKENAVNNFTIPETAGQPPLDGGTNGTQRILDQQIALGYTRLFGADKVLDARLGLSRTKAGKYNLSIGQTPSSIPNLPTAPPVVVGGLPSLSFNTFSTVGRQSTNPQWQDPALIDPKINFTWVKGRHSMKFGYEYEHIWMGVEDNNPLYGGFGFTGGYSACATASDPTCLGKSVADSYWADFLFGIPNSYTEANYYEAHLLQTIESVYAQDDWKASPKLTLNLGLRWEYGSPYGELHNNISNFDPVSQTVFTITPGAVAGNGITPVSPSGTYGSTLVHPDLADFAPRVGFAYSIDPKTVIRGGFGTSFVHYTRAGSGDILGINAPQAQFASVSPQPVPPAPGTKCPVGAPATTCTVTLDAGFPTSLTTFNKATDNINWVPQNTRDSYVESYFLSVQRELAKNIILDIAYVGSHGVKLQGFLNGNQKNPSLGFARPYANWPSDITEALNEFYSHYDSLQVKYEQRFVQGLTFLNAFTWEHSLDNASASLEGNTPSPQDGNNLRADYAQSDYNLPVADIASIVYELPFGRGRTYLNGINPYVDGAIGGWQLSIINTMQAGTPFNITYSPGTSNAVSQQISATYRGANEYRPDVVPGQPLIQQKQLTNGTGYIQYINYNAFIAPPVKDSAGDVLSPFGNLSRNPLRLPAFYQTDLSLNKKFSTPIESLKFEFRAEFYNILNKTNYYLPSSGLTTAPATLPASAGTYATGSTVPVSAIPSGNPSNGGVISSTFTPRVIQFGFKAIY